MQALRVLILGDSPFLKTGFGIVNSHAMKAMLEAGMKVATVTALQSKGSLHPIPETPGVTIFQPEQDDPMGRRTVAKAVKKFKPDVIFGVGDPGNVTVFSKVIPAGNRYLAYVPVEGEPLILDEWRRVLNGIDFFTCSEYGANVVAASIGKRVDWVYHGVDTDVFRPLSAEDRQTYRQRLGWDGKFVVTCVAQNVGRKQLPRLIEAIAILKHRFNQHDIALYLHTVPYQGHYLDGWDLPSVARGYDVESEVVFNPLMARRNSSIPETGSLDVPGLRELLSSADLFVLPSKVEGFGLPIVEAMASGTPVMVTKYAAGWEVASRGGGAGIPVHDWEVHKSGTRYGHVDPMVLAKEILRLRRDPKRLVRMREQGLEATKVFNWAAFEKMVVEKVIDASSRPRPATEAESDIPEKTDPAARSGTQDDLREDQGQVGPAPTNHHPRSPRSPHRRNSSIRTTPQGQEVSTQENLSGDH